MYSFGSSDTQRREPARTTKRLWALGALGAAVVLSVLGTIALLTGPSLHPASFQVTRANLESVVATPAGGATGHDGSSRSLAEVALGIRNIGGKAAEARCVVTLREGAVGGAATVQTPAQVQPQHTAELSVTVALTVGTGKVVVSHVSCVAATSSASLRTIPGSSQVEHGAIATTSPNVHGLPHGFPDRFVIPAQFEVASAVGLADTAKGLPSGSHTFQVSLTSPDSPSTTFGLVVQSLRSGGWQLSSTFERNTISSVDVRGFGYRGSVVVLPGRRAGRGVELTITLEGA